MLRMMAISITADGCLLTLNGALFLIGGSKSKYRYADDPSKVWVLPKNGRSWRDDVFPPLLGSRMWPGCTLANIEGEVWNFTDLK
jgi:hypothetical protein